MAITRANMNWSSVVHGSTTITRVTTASFKTGGKLVKFSADADVIVSVIAVGPAEPSATITTADIGTAMGFSAGQTGSLVASLEDAMGVASGGVTFTLANCVFENADASDTHAQIGTCPMNFSAYATDGATNPLSITRF